jgi:hypothetical protein
MEVFRSRVSIPEPHAETLDALWTGGWRNGAELWRRLRIQGFQGSLRVVSEWATRRRLDESSNPVGRVRKTPSARKISRLMTIERDQVPKDHASIMAKIERDVPRCSWPATWSIVSTKSCASKSPPTSANGSPQRSTVHSVRSPRVSSRIVTP